MSVKIRLQRHGKKGKPFYWIVAADARAKRDGRYLQKLGTYNPNTNPATINLDIDKSVNWLQFGAQPTDTARNILSYKGVLMKNHLKNGVRKGALTEEQVEEKFEQWLSEKSSSIDSKKSSLVKQSISPSLSGSKLSTKPSPSLSKPSSQIFPTGSSSQRIVIPRPSLPASPQSVVA